MVQLNQSIVEEVFKEIIEAPTNDDDDNEEEQDRALSNFFLCGQEPSTAVINLFSEVQDVTINNNYFSIPMLGYYLPSNSLLYKLISATVSKSVQSLTLRSSHPRCLTILNGIENDLTKLHITREVLEDGDCFKALTKITTQKLAIDAEKMGNNLLKILPITTRELEINDFAFVKIEDGDEIIQNPKLASIEKLCIREYNVHQDAAFQLPKLIAAYRKCFPKTKSFDFIFYTTADRDSNILRHFYTKNIKDIRKQNSAINLRIYIDVEFVKDDPMPDAYKRKLVGKMDLIEGFNGAKKFLQISKKISLELICSFQP